MDNAYGGYLYPRGKSGTRLDIKVLLFQGKMFPLSLEPGFT